mmetsp:Transcript_38401/g.90333  ORF Transcript_38401/g.90333 Transcript_38401/m.90333 type:complete len:296 (+) Transcript_38401:304-1191(+)|eukprot:CAMPEP_0178400262 /NCGR_PEP_ID=MMETSP0689_2-20121128/15700_1 /TAXON_ID=160604 /ORGANISM="Amphidinium massartii, Strain CS-259" /LENGTH=295 /DNA_ID=CAMNT_0020021055 /DNA_START=242 /DNA_END=1129 /DNA_ORIENTATION=+
MKSTSHVQEDFLHDGVFGSVVIARGLRVGVRSPCWIFMRFKLLSNFKANSSVWKLPGVAERWAPTWRRSCLVEAAAAAAARRPQRDARRAPPARRASLMRRAPAAAGAVASAKVAPTIGVAATAAVGATDGTVIGVRSMRSQEAASTTAGAAGITTATGSSSIVVMEKLGTVDTGIACMATLQEATALPFLAMEPPRPAGVARAAASTKSMAVHPKARWKEAPLPASPEAADALDVRIGAPKGPPLDGSWAGIRLDVKAGPPEVANITQSRSPEMAKGGAQEDPFGMLLELLSLS